MKKISNKFVNFIYFGNRFRNPFLKKELGFISRYLPAKPCILEAGAHTGSDTIRMAHAFKGSMIYSFEPEPSAYKKLTKKAYGYGNIHTYNCALGSRDEKKELFVSKDLLDASSSLLPQGDAHKKLHPQINLDQNIKVDVCTIDSWAKKNNVSRIDFMWLDMQGNELSALKSAESILPTVKAIYTEVLIAQTYENAPLYPEMRAWMDSKGFKVEREDLEEEQGNVLFIRK